MPTTTLPRVGFIGLGVMGRPMAGHILTGLAGRAPLTISNRSRDGADELIDGGAVWVDTPREVAAASDVVLVMVPDLPQIAELAEGPDGLLAGVDHPMVLVVSSTVAPDGVRRLDQQFRIATDGQLRVIDAPVSGGERGAVAGTLSIMVGGDDEPVARALPVLELTGRPVHLGGLGAGQVAKACNQLICAANIAAIAEASVVAERAGLDVGMLFDLLQGGYAGSTILADKGPRYAAKDYSVSGAAYLWIKDLKAYLDEARRTGTATLQGDRLLDAFDDLTEQGLGGEDTAVIQKWLAERPTT
ncbi:NAD(P)-dependent oxidoreductase [Enemella evansiae]|uniref:NAD(P)-dependent oxidoreductase n=1 Tax=Enemella evansiae TaxID=2016499 RepID=UPI00105B5A57|nr:NAD(P)-dependent oxidoreductase [Enemella evansiae]TDO93733.1 2-hydroxy-3-oxopropionate reductase [Enemella evansiae]